MIESLGGLVASEIKKLIEFEGKKADHFEKEKERFNKETIYLTEELDRLIRTEELVERRHKNETLKQDREARKDYANKTFWLTCVWAALIFIVIFSLATKKLILFPNWEFSLSDKVIITLITSTTVNFFGFFLLVIKYLFHTANTSSLDKKKKTSVKNNKEDI